jgi:hypothetical protein
MVMRLPTAALPRKISTHLLFMCCVGEIHGPVERQANMVKHDDLTMNNWDPTNQFQQ